MQKNHTGKILAIGIIVLFIGVSVSSAVSNEDKASTSENENLLTEYRDIYENTNCFVMGSVGVAWNRIYKEGSICAGWKRGSESYYPSMDRPFCDWLFYKYEYYLNLSVYYRDFAWNYKKNDRPFLGAICDIISDFFGYLSTIYNIIYYGLDCQKQSI